MDEEQKLAKARQKIQTKAIIQEDGCWLWPQKRRYGSLRIASEADAAHRWAYRAFTGPIGDMHVLHSCDNTLCVNPAHLFLGTHQQNMADMAAKDRSGTRQLDNLHGKFTDEDIREIRRRYQRGFPPAWLASDYGTTPQYIRDIVKRRHKGRTGRYATRYHADSA